MTHAIMDTSLIKSDILKVEFSMMSCAPCAAMSIQVRYEKDRKRIFAVEAEALSMTPSGDALKKDLEERKQ